MKVNINEMTDRERVVLTKEQLQSYTDECIIYDNQNFITGEHYVKTEFPEAIEVEEVLGGVSVPIIEERREAAERLRNIDTSDEPLNAALMLVGIKRAIGTFVVRKEWPTYESCLADNERTLNRLADLIEPSPERTCRNIGGDKWEFMCSECGGHTHGSPFHIPDAERDELARALGGRIASLHGSVPRYCPFCGAKVEEP